MSRGYVSVSRPCFCLEAKFLSRSYLLSRGYVSVSRLCFCLEDTFLSRGHVSVSRLSFCLEATYCLEATLTFTLCVATAIIYLYSACQLLQELR